MEWMLAAILVLCIGIIFFLGYQLLSRRNNEGLESSRWIDNLQVQFNELRDTFHEQIHAMSNQMQDHQKFNTNLVQNTQHGYQDALGKVHSKLGELQTATSTMVDIGKDISSLQDILKSPKMRGGLGELFLADLLSQILPRENFELQYSFKTNNMVDAVIRLGEGLIPVDAKFPLENFRKMQKSDPETEKSAQKLFYTDVKKHIDAIASKYILPQEGTMDFAMMYIPAENIYYEIIIKPDSGKESLATYAMSKKVIPVSPNSFYAYLQAIVRGLKGLKIEKSAQVILKSLGQLENDIDRVMGDLEKVGGHLSHAQSAFDRTHKGFDRMKTKLTVLEGSNNEKLLED